MIYSTTGRNASKTASEGRPARGVNDNARHFRALIREVCNYENVSAYLLRGGRRSRDCRPERGRGEGIHEDGGSLREGTETEPKLGTHIWPGRNNVIFMAVPDDAIAGLDAKIRQLKQEHPRAGVRSFLLPIEELGV